MTGCATPLASQIPSTLHSAVGSRRLTVCRPAPNICGDRDMNTNGGPHTRHLSREFWGLLKHQEAHGLRLCCLYGRVSLTLYFLLGQPMGSSSSRQKAEESEIRVFNSPGSLPRDHRGTVVFLNERALSTVLSPPSLLCLHVSVIASSPYPCQA